MLLHSTAAVGCLVWSIYPVWLGRMSCGRQTIAAVSWYPEGAIGERRIKICGQSVNWGDSLSSEKNDKKIIAAGDLFLVKLASG